MLLIETLGQLHTHTYRAAESQRLSTQARGGTFLPAGGELSLDHSHWSEQWIPLFTSLWNRG